METVDVSAKRVPKELFDMIERKHGGVPKSLLIIAGLMDLAAMDKNMLGRTIKRAMKIKEAVERGE